MSLKKDEYVIGVSSGFFSIAPQEEKEQYLTIMKKVFWGAQKGVNFTQLDLESITEFKEPFVENQIEKLRELGIDFGIHGETAATVREHTMPLDSATFDDYHRAHQRLIAHINGAIKLKAKYLLTHASESMPIPLSVTRDLGLTKSVDFWGRPLEVLLQEEVGKKVLEWAAEQKFIKESRHLSYAIGGEYERVKREFLAANKKKEEDLTQEEEARLYKLAGPLGIIKLVRERDFDYGPERIPYLLIAKYMEITKDSIWVAITGGKTVDELHNQYQKWVPAVAAKYLWGHFNPRSAEEYKRLGVPVMEDPKPLLEKGKLFFVLEPQMAQLGYEEHMRLHNILHIYWLVRDIKSDWVGIAFDIEHTLSGNWDIKKEILPNMADDMGKFVKVMHLGWPTTHVPAHIPIYLGSEAQQYIYEILFELRKKGFDRGWMIFERGGGQDPVKDSVVSLRNIVKYLLKDTPPDKLPLDFYGLEEEGGEVTRQLLIIKEHALDPLKGVLHVPEEEFGILSTGAAQKGKLEEWKKERFK